MRVPRGRPCCSSSASLPAGASSSSSSSSRPQPPQRGARPQQPSRSRPPATTSRHHDGAPRVSVPDVVSDLIAPGPSSRNLQLAAAQRDSHAHRPGEGAECSVHFCQGLRRDPVVTMVSRGWTINHDRRSATVPCATAGIKARPRAEARASQTLGGGGVLPSTSRGSSSVHHDNQPGTSQGSPLYLPPNNNPSLAQWQPNRNANAQDDRQEQAEHQHPDGQMQGFGSIEGVGPSQQEVRRETTEALPDILNSHMLPPYAAARPNQHRSSRQSQERRSGGGSSRTSTLSWFGRTSLQQSSQVTQLENDDKECCSSESARHCLTVITTFRWVLVSLAMLGVCCVVTVIVLGALHMTVGSSFLTLSLMFIGLGVMLVVVVGVGWRCTPLGHEPCHLLFHLGDHAANDFTTTQRGFRRRDRTHWYGGMLYPEFRYRRPPPSYTASMQDYNQQLMMAQIQGASPPQVPPQGDSLPNSPPPTYRSQASTLRPGIHITFPSTRHGEYPSSRPPTYRSSDHESRPRLQINISDTSGDRGGERTHESADVVSYTHHSHDCMASSHEPSPARSSAPEGSATPGSGRSSTLQNRAQQVVVEYLDSMLDEHILVVDRGHGSSSSGTMRSSASGSMASSHCSTQEPGKCEALNEEDSASKCDAAAAQHVDGDTGEVLVVGHSDGDPCVADTQL